MFAISAVVRVDLCKQESTKLLIGSSEVREMWKGLASALMLAYQYEDRQPVENSVDSGFALGRVERKY